MVQSSCLCILNREMPESANTQDSDTLVRFQIRPTEAAPYSVAGAENWRRLFVRQALGQQIVASAYMGMSSACALKLNPCGLLVGAKMFAPAQAPITWPQVAWTQATPTRSPTFLVRTPGPTETISPTGSWPRISGNAPGRCPSVW